MKLGSLSSRGCCLNGAVITKANGLAANPNIGAPLLLRIAKVHPSNTRGVPLANKFVLAVLAIGRLSKIAPGIVGSVPVNMINLILRPFASHPKPSNSVREVVTLINSNVDVAVNLGTSNCTARFKALAHCDQPYKMARRLVIVKKTTNLIGGNIRFSHEALQLLIGQRPDGVGSTVRASLFYSV